MLVVLTETYCNKVNIQITQRDDFIQILKFVYLKNGVHLLKDPHDMKKCLEYIC